VNESGNQRRIVVTGLGLVTPLGIGVKETWNGIREGRSGIGRITKFDPTDYSCQIAGEVKGFDPTNYMDAKEARKMDPFIHYAVVAGSFAMEDSGLRITSENDTRVGVSIGVGMGGLPVIEKYHEVVLARGPRKITPFFIPMLIANMAAGHLSMKFGAKGPNCCSATACATGTHAIGDSFEIIRRGDADVMVAGGAESVITKLGIGGFCAMKALSAKYNAQPEKGSRPFDRDRDGFVMGEGSGVMVLEELEFAKRRGARIYAEVVGYGMNADAYHMTLPPPEGEGAARCMNLALKKGNVRPEEIDYINAHGTGTAADVLETKAIKSVFGDHAYKLAVSSTKSMTGHLLGAAGGIEGVFSVLAIENGTLPPTINLENPDPECDLDYVPNQSREREINLALSNSFGFGGTNACVIFKKFSS
jgi:3-oxoacyl-[acyl-carrier-protein] synthase II